MVYSGRGNTDRSIHMGRYYIKTSVFSYKKGKKMIKIGIIGLGRIGKVHIKSISTKIGSAKVVAAAATFIDFHRHRARNYVA